LGNQQLDAVIDSVGGDIMVKVAKLLKPGGTVVCYGMWVLFLVIVDHQSLHSNRTAAPSIPFTMREVLRNQKLLGMHQVLGPRESMLITIKGSTMGSRQDLINATDFLVQHRIVPIVSHVIDGLESAEEGFEILKQEKQFGKVVIKVRDKKLTSNM